MTHAIDADQVSMIGAGPWGSFAAERLARAGLSVLLLEKDAVPGAGTVCGAGCTSKASRAPRFPTR